MLWNCKADSGGKQGLILAQGAILQCWKFCLQVVIDFFFVGSVTYLSISRSVYLPFSIYATYAYINMYICIHM